MANEEKFSQAARRKARVMRDQHGDEYDVTIEVSTGHPTGPISARLNSPLPVPSKYLKPSLTDDTKLIIDYDQWEMDEDTNVRDWDLEALRHASEMYGDAAAEKIEQMPPALLARVGTRPNGSVLVKQRRIGNKWLRGIPGAEMPEQARKYFPEPEETKTEAWEVEEEVAEAAFPLWGGPANGWVTSDRKKWGAGDEAKEAATQHQKTLDAALV